jgi:hypothetical protein
MADTNPARALNVVKRAVEMCDFIEHPAIRQAVEQEMVPVTMPRTVEALVDISVWVGLGTVGLWAALDAFAERTGFWMAPVAPRRRPLPYCRGHAPPG